MGLREAFECEGPFGEGTLGDVCYSEFGHGHPIAIEFGDSSTLQQGYGSQKYFSEKENPYRFVGAKIDALSSKSLARVASLSLDFAMNPFRLEKRKTRCRSSTLTHCFCDPSQIGAGLLHSRRRETKKWVVLIEARVGGGSG